MARWLFSVMVCCVVAGSSIDAATVYLKTGESLNGKIIQMDDQSLSLASHQGFGVLQIDRNDIILIEFEETQHEVLRKSALGYYFRNLAVGGQSNSGSYSVGALSYQTWLSQTSAMGVHFGYSDTNRRSENTFRIINLEGRYLKVLKRFSSAHTYYGGAIGFLSVTDRAQKISSSTNPHFNGFVGVEIFPKSIPSLSFSGELGLAYQKAGPNTSISFFNSGFPSMSVHYYF